MKFLTPIIVLIVIFCFLITPLHAVNKIVVCIDPGHPSETSDGSWIGNGISELEVNWQVAQVLAEELNKHSHISVLLTRENINQLTTNRQRAEIANQAGACLLLRLHCDANKRGGFTLYYPNQQGKKGKFKGPSAEVIKKSQKAANMIHQAMKKVLSPTLKDHGILGDNKTFIGKKQGALTGSIFAEVPTVLVEMVELYNKKDATFIKSKAGQQKMAKALTTGILAWVDLQKPKVVPTPIPPKKTTPNLKKRVILSPFR